MNYNTEFLQTGPCDISYRGLSIGVTLDNPHLTIHPEIYAAAAREFNGEAVSRVIMNTKITVSMVVKKVNHDFAELPEAKNKFSGVVFNKNILDTGGELCLYQGIGKNRIKYCFTRAVLIPETVCVFKRPGDVFLKLDFDLHEDADGVFMLKFSPPSVRPEK